MNNDQEGIVIILGVAGHRRGLGHELAVGGVDRIDLNLCIAAVPHVFKQRDLRHGKANERNQKGGRAHERLPLINREDRSKDFQAQLSLFWISNNLHFLCL